MGEKNVCQEINAPEEISRQYAEFIEELRSRWGVRGFRQNQLAQKAAVNPSSLNKFINRGTVPSFEIMYKLIHAYLCRPPISLEAAPDYTRLLNAISLIKSIISELP